MSYDVRSIANFVLDLAEADGHELSNMQVNKIVYFLHVDYLAVTRRPLVSAKIEAWEHGPVFRELYSQLKVFGDGPVRARLTSVDPHTGSRSVVSSKVFDEEFDFVTEITRRYYAMSAGALRAQSHEPGGPWDRVWNHDTKTNASMRITDEDILDWFGKGAKH